MCTSSGIILKPEYSLPHTNAPQCIGEVGQDVDPQLENATTRGN
jgi:hypothetical protein